MNDGFLPFEDSMPSDDAIEKRIQGGKIEPPKNASPEFGRIILKACSYDTFSRYNSMDEMLHELNNISKTEPVKKSYDYYGTVVVEDPNMNAYVNNSNNIVDSAAGIRTNYSKMIKILITILVLLIIAMICVIVSGKKSSDDSPHISASTDQHH